jgi:hypothetical protein
VKVTCIVHCYWTSRLPVQVQIWVKQCRNPNVLSVWLNLELFTGNWLLYRLNLNILVNMTRTIVIFCIQFVSSSHCYCYILCNAERIFSATFITNDIFITITFNTNTYSVNVDVAYVIRTSISVVQNQRNANPNVESNATQRHLYTRKRNPEFDWNTADETKAFGIVCVCVFGQEDCEVLHVTARGFIRWKSRIYFEKMKYIRTSMLRAWTRMLNGKNSKGNGGTILTLCSPLH